MTTTGAIEDRIAQRRSPGLRPSFVFRYILRLRRENRVLRSLLAVAEDRAAHFYSVAYTLSAQRNEERAP